MKEAVFVSAVRTAVGKAPKGTLKNTRPDEMGAAVIEEAVRRAEGLEKTEIEDVVMGCALPEGSQKEGENAIQIGATIVLPAGVASAFRAGASVAAEERESAMGCVVGPEICSARGKSGRLRVHAAAAMQTASAVARR